MTHSVRWIRHFARDDAGATMTEYGVVLVLIAAVCIAVVAAIGGHVNQDFQSANSQLP